MDKAHQKAGMIWKGRKEAPTIVEVQEPQTKESLSKFGGDLD